MTKRIRPLLPLILRMSSVALIAFVCFFFVAPVFAQDSFGVNQLNDTIALGSDDIRVTIARIIRTALGFLGVIAVGIVLFGGFMYMTAGGSDEKVGTAKKIMMNGAIGLAIILSSFAIVQFVFSRLSDATGSGAVPTVVVDPQQGCAGGVCFSGGGGGGDSCLKKNDLFVLEGITPNQDATNINNVAVRAVFSKSVATAPEQILDIQYDGKSVPTSQYTAAFVPNSNSQVVEITFKSDDGVCAGTDKNCLLVSEKKYSVKATAAVKDASGKTLENEKAGQVCGASFADILTNGTSFIVNKKASDADNPFIDLGILVNGQITKEPGTKLASGKDYTAKLKVTDASGIGYVRVEMFEFGKDVNLIDEWYAPTGKSNLPYVMDIPFTVAANIPLGTQYSIRVTAQDIDHKKATIAVFFTVVGGTCSDGIKNGDETGIDVGGSCGKVAGSFCESSADCANGYVCEEKVCKAVPYITAVSPLDGAVGNYITVYGKHFGTTPGKVEFGVVNDPNSKPFMVDTWIPATLPACALGGSWHDGYIIVQVPADTGKFVVGSKSAIRVTTAAGKEDTTINNLGAIPVPDGLFSKNTTKRPNLCLVVNKDAAGYAVSKDPVHAIGSGFGSKTGAVVFGGVTSTVLNWADGNIETAIAENMTPGNVAAWVEVAGEKSNSVPFSIVSAASDVAAPVISNIDPAETTPKSYITISGNGFGDNGKVYFNNKKNNACPSAECVAAEVSLTACGDTWSNKQIIAEIPENIPAGKTYYVVVVNDNNIKSTGHESIKVNEGLPLPSICALSPKSGPSPLPPGHQGLTLSGRNFSKDPIVYFFKKGASLTTVDGWFSSKDISDPAGFKPSDSSIVTQLPQKDGVSMPTGPIRVQANGKLSNSIAYEVQDCTVTGSKPPAPGYQCCAASGPDKGLWKKDDQVCQGDARNAGYVWRFTTGIFPEIPEVIEKCMPGIPASPSPWVEQGAGTNACINAQMYVGFSMNMDPASLNKDTVKVFTCGQGKEPACTGETKLSVPATIDVKQVADTAIEISAEKGQLEPNTWYHVELSDKITSLKTAVIAGKQTTTKVPLLKTRTCGNGTAYCYDFKTGQGQCEIKSVGILPVKHTTNGLGIIQHPDYLPFSDDIENPMHPLLFETWAAADQACTQINTKALPWTWSINKPAAVEPVLLADASSHIRARAKEHAPDGVVLSAVTSYKQKTLTATSTISVDLLDPKVVGFEPNCSESCINPQIRVQFNRDMDVQTYLDGFELYECGDANCLSPKKISLSADLNQSTKKELVAHPKLKPNMYYKVVLSDAIKSIAGINTTIKGKGLASFNWFFKTQNSATACAVDRVDIQPNPFTANTIGQKIKYNAIPFSAPNACSKYGQALDKWDYSYNWKSVDPLVASISSFPHIETDKLAGACTLGCLPKGSDILSTQTAPKDMALCGNSTVDLGEDCDIAAPGEKVGTSCTLNCLRPGNKNVTTCGNGSVDTALGEVCDPAKDGKEFCAADCRWIGSGAFDATKAGSVCGDGKVTKGETCDGGANCSAQCLYTGTQLAATWCASNASYADTTECVNSLSVCGNGKLEAEEECEAQAESTVIRVGNSVQAIGVNPKAHCSTSCRLQNVCAIPLALQAQTNNLGGVACEKGTDGCSLDCRITGSSPVYGVPSLCGDGIVGVGEYPACEVKAVSKVGQSPVQIVTAVGAKQTATKLQQTEIHVTLEGTPAHNATSSFALQCGYTEFVTPQYLETKAVFNDCSSNNDGVHPLTSCCLPRPVRKVGSEYPLNGAGFDGKNLVCPNTAIFATFSKQIKEDTLPQNILVAKGYTVANFDCASIASSSIDVTARAKGTLVSSYDGDSAGFWQKMWGNIKSFFAELFGRDNVIAEGNSVELEKYKTWCTIPGSVTPTIATIPATAVAPTSTKIMLDIETALDGESVYAVMMKGGNKGVTDSDGIGIKNPLNAFTLDDGWAFKTKKEVCKISSVLADPANFLFTTPAQERQFVVSAKTVDNQFIVPTSAYDWKWQWNPTDNPVFNLINPTLQVATIKPKGAQGHLTAAASAVVTKDVSAVNNQQGKSFSAPIELTAAFCEHPWPAYKDGKFNYSFAYCPDAGKSLNITDDLPYLSVVDVTGESSSKQVTIKQCALNAVGAVPKTCAADTDCPVNGILFNLPADDAGKDCDSDDPMVLAQNGCSVYNLAGYSGICRVLGDDGNTIYPSQYGKTYRGCNAHSDCKESYNGKQETCTMTLPTQFYLVDKNQCVEKKITEKVFEASKAVSQSTLKKVLFISDKSDDAIGLQIFENPKRLSAAEWFAIEKGFGGTGKIQPVTIGEYEGITDGSSFYVNALNVDKTQVYNNIYLFSINPDAQPDTKKVFGQLLSSLSFNTNLTNHGYCLKPGVDKFSSDITSISCQSDFDCLDPVGTPLKDAQNVQQTNGICSINKTKFLRDWKRLSDVKKALLNLETYKQKNTVYPDMKSGTYIPGYTVTKWSSWGELSQKVGGLPIDPLNKWTQCGSSTNVADQATCWNAGNSTFSCPVKSSVYEYAYSTSTKGYTLHVPFEFFDLKNAAVKKQLTDEFIPNPDALSPDQKCVPDQVYSPFGGSCGDSIVQPGEQCDPVGKKLMTSSAIGAIAACQTPGQYKELTCTAACQWQETKACSFGGSCGNGVIEGGETCDDGLLNGTYGHCTKDTCQLPVDNFCGDGKVQPDHEQCDYAEVAKYPNKDGYNTNMHLSCSGECKYPGPYCGDNIKQGLEECDDGNTNNYDACNASCKNTNLACLQQAPQYANYSNNESLLFLTRVDASAQDNITKTYLSLQNAGVTVLEKSTSTFAVAEHINSCFNKTNGSAICATIGAECKSVFSTKYMPASGAIVGAEFLKCGDDLTAKLSSETDIKYMAVCTKKYTPTVIKTDAAPAASCGNGKVEAGSGEICDEGAGKNGIACVPGYGKSCTYCANDCKKVLTVDPTAFCGNGKIDNNEVCDFTGTLANQKTVITTSSPNGISCGGDLKGSYQCQASCTQINNGCLACAVGESKPVPQITFLNPMVKPEFSPYSHNEFVELSTVGGKYLGYTKINYSAQTAEKVYFDYQNSLYLSLQAPHYLLIDKNFKPIDNLGLETSLLCKDEYRIFYNKGSTDSGDYFPYPVNGELSAVNNEIIMSPAVPLHAFRVVVRWTDVEAKKGASFVGATYHGNLLTQYSNAIPGPSGTGGKICDKTERDQSGYFVPAIGLDGCKAFENGIFIHPLLHGTKNHIQSFTIDMNELTNSAQPLGFMVQSIAGPIAPYVSSGLTVDVYRYKAGQSASFSVYAPETSFKIADAAGTSNNSLAKYWHVFNIVNTGNGYEIQLIKDNGEDKKGGTIESDECQVSKNLPEPASISPKCTP